MQGPRALLPAGDLLIQQLDIPVITMNLFKDPWEVRDRHLHFLRDLHNYQEATFNVRIFIHEHDGTLGDHFDEPVFTKLARLVVCIRRVCIRLAAVEDAKGVLLDNELHLG